MSQKTGTLTLILSIIAAVLACAAIVFVFIVRRIRYQLLQQLRIHPQEISSM